MSAGGMAPARSAIMPPLMTDQDRSDWLTVDQAAARLGVSAATIKRRIQDGKPVKLAGGGSVALDAEMLERPQGHEWRVRLRGELPPLTSDHERTDSESDPPIRSDQERSDALSAALSASLTAMTAMLEAEGTERQKLAQEARELAERVGRAEESERNACDALEAVTLERNALAERAATAETTAADEQARREAAERELQALRAWRWWKPSTW